MHQIVYCIVFSLLLGSCTPKNQNNIENVKNSNFNLPGNYVTGDYHKRSEGYDWVAVKVHEITDSILQISLRSRADIKKPTCTFDAMAYKTQTAGIFNASIEGYNVIFVFTVDSLVISGETEQDNQQLGYFCSGGGNIAGVYKKLTEPLDTTQIDKVVFRKALNYTQYNFFIEVYGNKLTIQPVGLEVDNTMVEHVVEGTVINAEAGDLNIDGFPEVLVYIQSAGSGSYGSVIGYSVNNGKSMSMIANLPPVAENPEASEGYMGHDEFAIVESSLIQRFPIYKPGDVNAKPTGGTRQVQYKLVDGEAMRQFVVDQVAEY